MTAWTKRLSAGYNAQAYTEGTELFALTGLAECDLA